MSQPAPDILVPYTLPCAPGEDGLAPGARPASYAVVYVRPETNSVLYERAIAAAIRRRGDQVVYLANLGGGLILQDGILRGHYATQLRFAEDPQRELASYPEIARRLDRHFGASPGKLRLLGAFEAVARIGMSEEELFEAFVPQAEILACWGQQFKRIAGAVVANPGLPAVLKRCGPGANLFVAAVRSAEGSPQYFASLNRAIYEEVCSHKETPLVDGDLLGSVRWSERVRRTYHISRTDLMAMFDMADFVYLDAGRRLEVAETPLGRSLLAEGVLTAEKLQAMKRDPLVRLPAAGDNPLPRRGNPLSRRDNPLPRRGGRQRHGGALHYLPLTGEGQSLDWIREFLREI
jgi:hypothetical protein